MPTTILELERRYRLALEVFLELGGEDALQKAYEVGREVIAGGMGVLEVSEIHGLILADLLGRVPTKRVAEIVIRSMTFLHESLSPFEMTLRGFRENNDRIRRLIFLTEASAIFNACLDGERTLRSFAQFTVPFLADWCLVHVFEPSGSIRCSVAAHADPTLSDIARRLERTLAIVPGWVSRAIVNGRPEIIVDNTYSWLEGADVILPVKSALVVPLVARQKALGIVVFLSAESGKMFNSSDRILAEDLGRRCACAIDNSRVHAEVIRQRDEAQATIDRLVGQQPPVASDGIPAEEGKTMPPIDEPVRVLLLEDSQDVLLLMKKELEWAGFTVYTAADGEAGLEVAQREVPDVIVSDIRMPGMDGYQFMKQLRTFPALVSIPAIALTGFGMEQDIDEAHAVGYIEHMVKPVDVSRLIETIARLART